MLIQRQQTIVSVDVSESVFYQGVNYYYLGVNSNF
jgi:hypothetical protein